MKLNKTRSILLLVLSFHVSNVLSQNLVPNPSFESYTVCPSIFGQIQSAVPWYDTNSSESEFFHTCGTSIVNVPNTGYGYQLPRTGNGYAGQYFMNGYGGNNREYIQVALTSSLVSGNCYFVKFYVNSVNKIINYVCNNFAAHISIGGYATANTAATSYTPQIFLVNNPIVRDTLNWVEIGGIFTASGGEDHITIGNFKNDVNTDTLKTNLGTVNAAYYHIDDVSVQQITTPIWQLKDTMIINGDSVLIGPLYSGLNCSWFNMLGNPIGTGSAFWVKPTTTTSYVLQQTFCNTTFSDTITVNVSALGLSELNKSSKISKLFPNPNSGEFNIEITKASREKPIEVSILDVTGKELYNKTISGISLNLKPDLTNGIYMVKVRLQDGTTDTHRLVINR